MNMRLQFPLTIPFVEELGLELHRFDNGHAEVRVDLGAAHLNSWKVAHGGVLMTMLDVAMAHAARSVAFQGAAARSVAFQGAAARSVAFQGAAARSVAFQGAAARSVAHQGAAARSVHANEAGSGPGLVTIEMKTSFMRPAEGRLAAKATLLHRSATMAFCEGSVFDADQQLCAHATATFKYLRKLPTKGGAAKTLQRTDES
jgi:uncharacterized protein (TIGR00369 family)